MNDDAVSEALARVQHDNNALAAERAWKGWDKVEPQDVPLILDPDFEAQLHYEEELRMGEQQEQQQPRVEITRVCIKCMKKKVFNLNATAVKAWQSGSFIQDVFPFMSAGDREMLISSICSQCFDDMFKDGS